MTTQQFNALTSLKGERKFENKIYDFTHFKELTNGINVVVYSKNRVFTLLHSEIDQFINSLEDVPEKPKTEMVKSVKTEVNTIVMPSENIELKQILIDTLRSLKETPTKEVIGRAAAVVNVVNSMINLQKTEIQIYNIQKRINGSR